MVIVESHHHVLRAWAAYRAQLPKAPRLFTLDHHTDTSAPFRTSLKNESPQVRERVQRELLTQVDFLHPETVEAAIVKLDHDEHIVTAIKTDIIDSAFVIAQNAQDTDLNTYRAHRIICTAVDRKEPSHGLISSDCDVVLESSFLGERIDYFQSLLSSAVEAPLFAEPYILDIDLDYLNTLNSVVPKDARILQRLARNAGLITIAQESRHVRLCALEANVTSEYLLPRLVELLRV